jgi:hypothetical protein
MLKFAAFGAPFYEVRAFERCPRTHAPTHTHYVTCTLPHAQRLIDSLTHSLTHSLTN